MSILSILVTPDLIRGPASSGTAQKAAGPRFRGRGDEGLAENLGVEI